MKRDKDNVMKFAEKAKSDSFLKKQLEEAGKKSPKEAAREIVRLGRAQGFYFSEGDVSSSELFGTASSTSSSQSSTQGGKVAQGQRGQGQHTQGQHAQGQHA